MRDGCRPPRLGFGGRDGSFGMAAVWFLHVRPAQGWETAGSTGFGLGSAIHVLPSLENGGWRLCRAGDNLVATLGFVAAPQRGFGVQDRGDRGCCSQFLPHGKAGGERARPFPRPRWRSRCRPFLNGIMENRGQPSARGWGRGRGCSVSCASSAGLGYPQSHGMGAAVGQLPGCGEAQRYPRMP